MPPTGGFSLYMVTVMADPDVHTVHTVHTYTLSINDDRLSDFTSSIDSKSGVNLNRLANDAVSSFYGPSILVHAIGSGVMPMVRVDSDGNARCRGYVVNEYGFVLDGPIELEIGY